MNFHPRYIVTKAEGVEGPPIAADEPCLVIRAQDVLAQRMMNAYLDAFTELPYPETVEGLHSRTQLINELAVHQQAIGDWQRGHGAKMADR